MNNIKLISDPNPNIKSSYNSTSTLLLGSTNCKTGAMTSSKSNNFKLRTNIRNVRSFRSLYKLKSGKVLLSHLKCERERCSCQEETMRSMYKSNSPSLYQQQQRPRERRELQKNRKACYETTDNHHHRQRSKLQLEVVSRFEESCCFEKKKDSPPSSSGRRQRRRCMCVTKKLCRGWNCVWNSEQNKKPQKGYSPNTRLRRRTVLRQGRRIFGWGFGENRLSIRILMLVSLAFVCQQLFFFFLQYPLRTKSRLQEEGPHLLYSHTFGL